MIFRTGPSAQVSSLPKKPCPPLAGYLGLLIQWNRVMNLVGTRTAEGHLFTLVVAQPASRAFSARRRGIQRCTLLLGSGLGSRASRTSSAYDLARRRLLDGRSPKNEPCSCPRSSPNIPCPEPMYLPGPRRKRLWPDRPHGQRISSSTGRLCRGPAFWNSSKAT